MNALRVVPAIIGIPLAAGSLAAALCAIRGRPHSPAGLVIHDISPKGHPHLSWITPGTLRETLVSLRKAGRPSVSLKQWHAGPHHSCSVLTFDDGFESVHRYALDAFRQTAQLATVFMVAGRIGAPSHGDIFRPGRHLGSHHLRELACAGFEIGSHTLTHPDLTRLEPSELVRELADSRAILEDCIGQQVTALSFPYGGWNHRVWETAQECGYQTATAYRGHRLCTPDILPVYGAYAFDTGSQLAQRAMGTGHPLETTRALLMAQFSRGTSLWLHRPTYT